MQAEPGEPRLHLAIHGVRIAQWLRPSQFLQWREPTRKLNVKLAYTLGGSARVMHKRSVSDTIELDQSLRTAKGFYFVASVFAVPGAMISAVWLIADIGALYLHMTGIHIVSPMLLVWNIVFDIMVLGFAYIVTSQVLEAGRRIRRLAEDPAANVKPMYVPSILKSS